MSYYIIEQDVEIDGSASLDDLPDNIDPLAWLSGKLMDVPAGELIFDLSKQSGDYRGDIIDGLITLYHDELRNLLTAYGVDNIQYIPVRLRDTTNGKLEGTYSIANFTGLIECVDIENSTLISLPSGIGCELESFQIDESKTGGASIFRLAEEPTLVIATEHLVDHLIAAGAVGIKFTETTEYAGD